MRRVLVFFLYLLFIQDCLCLNLDGDNLQSNGTASYGRKSTNKLRLPGLRSSTLTDLGGIVVKMVDSLTSDSREIDMGGLTELVTSMSRSAVFVDHPEVSFNNMVLSFMFAFGFSSVVNYTVHI